MDSRTLFAVALLGLLVTPTLQQSQLLDYHGLQEEPVDKQLATIGTLLFNLVRPLASNLLSTLTTNLGSAFTNAFMATMANKTLELIPLEALLAEPIRDSAPAPHVTGAEPPRRRPYLRALDDHDLPLQSSGTPAGAGGVSAP